MNRSTVVVLASAGAIGALIAAMAISSLFLRFATETYAAALEDSGSSGRIQAAMGLMQLHNEIAEKGGLRGLLARSLLAHGGLVYTSFPKNEACGRPCEGFGCAVAACGVSIIYAADFSDISYDEGKVQIPPPKPSLWIYTLGVGALIGVGAGVNKLWIGRLSVAVIVGIPIWLLIVPQSPAASTIFMSGAAGGALAHISKHVFFRFEAPMRRNRILIYLVVASILAMYDLVWAAIAYYSLE